MVDGKEICRWSGRFILAPSGQLVSSATLRQGTGQGQAGAGCGFALAKTDGGVQE